MSQLRFLDYHYSLCRKKDLLSKWLSRKEVNISFNSAVFQSDHKEMKHVFDKIDADEDGLISRGDLRRLLKTLRATDFEVTMEKMMWVADANDSGVISFAKFIEINRNVSAGEIRAAFRYFDWDGDGSISVEDLKMAMECLEENCSEEDCRRIIRHLNRGDGEIISIDGFMAMMTADAAKPISE